MHSLNPKYWDNFKKLDPSGKIVGDGLAFEKLIDALLKVLYGTAWNATGQSHDNNRDFWMFLENEHLWAECKNYEGTIAMNILAPTLVMAQVYQVNTILFFSRSPINPSAKEKILTYGEKSEKRIIFYDGIYLEDLIWSVREDLPEQFRPLYSHAYEDIPKTFARIFFFQDAVPGILNTSDLLVKYEDADKIQYNKNFALTFVITNPFFSEQTQITIKFSRSNQNRYDFEYLSDAISPEKENYTQFMLQKGEGRSVSLIMRQIKYSPQLCLPRFCIEALDLKSGQVRTWDTPEKIVMSKWIGRAGLIGDYYHEIISQTDAQLVHNQKFSSLIITGSSGTGKTRILMECQNLFLKHGYQVISFIMQEDFTSACFFREIISFLYEIPGKEILELLEQKLAVPDTGHSTKENRALQLLKTIYQDTSEEALGLVVDLYGDILYEKMAQQKNVLIVDNLQFAGSAFQKFIKQYFNYSVNRQKGSGSVVACVFNLDYATADSSELLYNLLHTGVEHLLHKNVNGFETINQGILFLKELIRLDGDEDRDFLSEIVKKVSLNPYYLYQTVNYLEENDIIKITSSQKGYITSNLKKYQALQELSGDITSVLSKRFEFIAQKIPYDQLFLICSVLFVFDKVDKDLQMLFGISDGTLSYLWEKHILQRSSSDVYLYDHDIIRNYFFLNHKNHILDCLYWIREQNREFSLQKYSFPFRLYKIAVLKDDTTILETSQCLDQMGIPERLAAAFYDYLFNGHMKLLAEGIYRGIHIKYIHQICAYIRQYSGSVEALSKCENAYNTIQKYAPGAMSSDMKYYRPFIHFYCDISVELHLQDKTKELVNEVLLACQKTNSKDTENQDEIYVLEAILYNRMYVSHNIDSPTATVFAKRKSLMETSREYISKIKDPVKKGLIEYLNNSDEGYNYYGYKRDLDQLTAIWDKCIIDIPRLVPEKTLNYYRKMAQYHLIYQRFKPLLDIIDEALLYLEQGEHSHEPIIFRTFFSMAEVMGRIQNAPEKNYYYNRRIIDDILQMQHLLNNHKLGDILLLKGVNAFYAGTKDEVYYSFKSAYDYYSLQDTSRYWIKMELLKENLHYTFTALHLYEESYDFKCFPSKYREPMSEQQMREHIASGIQQTGDGRLNLPLI